MCLIPFNSYASLVSTDAGSGSSIPSSSSASSSAIGLLRRSSSLTSNSNRKSQTGRTRSSLSRTSSLSSSAQDRASESARWARKKKAATDKAAKIKPQSGGNIFVRGYNYLVNTIAPIFGKTHAQEASGGDDDDAMDVTPPSSPLSTDSESTSDDVSGPSQTEVSTSSEGPVDNTDAQVQVDYFYEYMAPLMEECLRRQNASSPPWTASSEFNLEPDVAPMAEETVLPGQSNSVLDLIFEPTVESMLEEMTSQPLSSFESSFEPWVVPTDDEAAFVPLFESSREICGPNLDDSPLNSAEGSGTQGLEAAQSFSSLFSSSDQSVLSDSDSETQGTNTSNSHPGLEAYALPTSDSGSSISFLPLGPVDFYSPTPANSPDDDTRSETSEVPTEPFDANSPVAEEDEDYELEYVDEDVPAPAAPSAPKAPKQRIATMTDARRQKVLEEERALLDRAKSHADLTELERQIAEGFFEMEVEQYGELEAKRRQYDRKMENLMLIEQEKYMEWEEDKADELERALLLAEGERAMEYEEVLREEQSTSNDFYLRSAFHNLTSVIRHKKYTRTTRVRFRPFPVSSKSARYKAMYRATSSFDRCLPPAMRGVNIADLLCGGYDVIWSFLSEPWFHIELTFTTVPWPIFNIPEGLFDITTAKVMEFISQGYPGVDQVVVAEAQLERWRPDHIEERLISRVVSERDRDLIRRGAKRVHDAFVLLLKEAR